jgi:hypothetical protein
LIAKLLKPGFDGMYRTNQSMLSVVDPIFSIDVQALKNRRPVHKGVPATLSGT